MSTDQAGGVGDDILKGGISNDALFGAGLRGAGLRARKKGMMSTMKHVVLAVMTAVSLALAGCGGGSSKPAGGAPAGGGQPTAPTPKSLDLSSFDDAAIMAGTLTITAGESGILGGLTYSCPAGGADCMVTVGDDKTATYTGGMPMVSLTPTDDGTPPAGDPPPSGGTPPAGDPPPSGGTPPAGDPPPSGGTPSTGGTPPPETPSVDVAELIAALEDRAVGAGRDSSELLFNEGAQPSQRLISQHWYLKSALHGQALGLRIADDPAEAINPTLEQLPALHGWAGTRATGSDDRYEHTLVLYTNLEAPNAGTADNRHTVFGWWLVKDKQDDTLTFEEIADVQYWDTDQRSWYSADPVSAPIGVTGTATYAGAAAGMYALKRQGQTEEAGEWTAKATVTAAFGDSTALGTVTGTLTEFMVGSQSRNWKVDLEQAGITGTDREGQGGRTSWTIDAVKGARPTSHYGAWAHYFNNNKGTPGGANSQPTGIHGRFSAQYGTEGHMDGAFGAHKN